MRRKVLLSKKKSEEAKAEVIVPSQFGLGIQEDTQSDSDFVTKNVEGCQLMIHYDLVTVL